MPSTTPTDTPTTAPGELGKITELKATKASQLTATFDSVVPADTTIAVTKGGSEIKGTSKIDGSTVVFDAEANLTTGTYTLTATLGEAKVSADVDVKDSYVAEIKITSKEALTGEVKTETSTGAALKEAYIYYDVLNQYGESIRNSTTIEWTTSVGNEGKKIDKSLGRITVRAEQAALNYGSLIYVTGVHTASGTVVNTSVPVGMAQAIDTIEFAGFINKDEPGKLIDSLPINFPNGKYLLAYRTFDQNGNPLEVKDDDITESRLTFISDNVLLIDPSSFKDKKTVDYSGVYAIDGVEYSAITVNPGEYVGKGGEVNITAISNKTGQKTVKNFVVGSAGLLQSLTLDTPADVVADGDEGVKIPYTAKDVDGKSVTNYETIVRSSNALNLTASDGTLYILEENDGTAGIYWSDESKNATDFGSISVDGVDRSVTLGTLVIGGDSNMMILPVSDARRPVAIKSIKLNSDDNNALVEGNEATIKLLGDGVVYLDQYGKELICDEHGKSILKAYFGNPVKSKKHAIKIKTDANGNNLKVKGTSPAPTSDWVKVFSYSRNGDNFDITLKADMGVEEKVDKIENPSPMPSPSPSQEEIDKKINEITELSTTFKFSVVESKTSSTDASEVNEWDNVDKEKNIVYTVVPVHQLSGYSISKLGKQEIVTNCSVNANFAAFAASGTSISGAAEGNLTVQSQKTNPNDGLSVSNVFVVSGKTKDGRTVAIPSKYYITEGQETTVVSGSAFEIAKEGVSTGKLSKVATGADLKWSDLYDENTARLTRRDAVKTLKISLQAPGLKNESVSQKITLSDAKAVPTTIRFYKDWSQYDPTDVTFVSNNTEIKYSTSSNKNLSNPIYYLPWNAELGLGRYTSFQVQVFDQYGKVFADSEKGISDGVDVGKFIEYTVSDINESTSEFTHLNKSFKVEQNGSTYENLKITGAELGDTYTLTATIPGTNVSKSVKVTVGADTKAYIMQGKDTNAIDNSDEKFRKDKLNYKK